MLSALSVVTTVVVGLMVGVEFCVAFFVNPIFDGLPANAGLAGRTQGARMLGLVMPFWYIGSLVLSSVWAGVGWGRGGAGLVVTAAVLLVVSVVMSLVLLVPINNRVKRWTEGNLPDDWKQQLHSWDRLHYARVAVIVASFTLLVCARA
jgi:uncharacterized membrane protein